MTEAAGTRSIELEVTIDAPVEVVWGALSRADGLENWFPLQARVTPGEGGSVWLSWGPGAEGEGQITVWEPDRRLAWSEGVRGEVAVVVDFVLESEEASGTTTLRLVHSGFGAGADWDEPFEATRAGWEYFLWNLWFYLTHHRGERRRMVWARRRTTRSVEDVWRSVLGEDGLDIRWLAAGQPYTVRLGRAVRHSGRAHSIRPPRNFAGTIESLNDGLMFLELETGAPAWHCGLWISLWGVPAETADRLQEGLDQWMDRLLGANG